MFRLKRTFRRPGRSQGAATKQSLKFSLRSHKKLFAALTGYLQAALSRAVELVKELARQPFSKRALKFVKRYSAQLSFAVLVTVFLTVAVGEGQAYDLPTPTLLTQLEATNDGFIGKPQILSTQTILTGEVEQVAAIVYTVEKGDTMLGIANRYDLSVGSILDANGIKPADAEKIKLGSQLIIPAVDTNTSLAWLDDINKEKERQRQLAETARQKELARQATQRRQTASGRTTAASRGDYSIVGRMTGSYNGGLPGWCTWYVNYKRPDLPNSMGNARDYLRSARAAGMATGTVARAGAIFQSRESSYGHVGYVERVNGDGTMTVSEMNYTGRYEVSRRTVSENIAVGFIY